MIDISKPHGVTIQQLVRYSSKQNPLSCSGAVGHDAKKQNNQTCLVTVVLKTCSFAKTAKTQLFVVHLQGLDMLAAAAEDGVPTQSISNPRAHTVSRSLMEQDPTASDRHASKSGGELLTIQRFDDLWRQAAAQGNITESDTTRTLHQQMLEFITQHSS